MEQPRNEFDRNVLRRWKRGIALGLLYFGLGAWVAADDAANPDENVAVVNDGGETIFSFDAEAGISLTLGAIGMATVLNSTAYVYGVASERSRQSQLTAPQDSLEANV